MKCRGQHNTACDSASAVPGTSHCSKDHHGRHRFCSNHSRSTQCKKNRACLVKRWLWMEDDKHGGNDDGNDDTVNKTDDNDDSNHDGVDNDIYIYI